MLELLFEPPIQKLDLTIFRNCGVEVFVKREDLIHPFVSGNKWRKLKYVLQDAKEQQKSTLVSFGGAYSNHLVALACAGAMFGFKTIAFVRGEEVQNHMLQLCKTYGMQLNFVSREVYKNKEELYQTIETNDTYFIDEGGKGLLAQKGCEEIVNDIHNFTHVLCAIGTGTTFAGIAKTSTAKGLKAEGICVLKGAESINEELNISIGHENNWHVHHHFHEGGYAKTSPQLWQLIDDTATKTGILFDQVYTAKMLKATIELAQQNYFAKGSRLLLIHTGGLLGLLSRQ
jgi:1-aminocyclopropane-1-carboxylate deaminase